MTPADAPTIAIAGGGIGGLTCATALQQGGFTVVVFERAPELREIGAGLLLTPNAVRVLRALNIETAVRAKGMSAEDWTILDRNGRALQQTSPARESDCTSISLHRADLQAELGSRLRGSLLQLDHEVAGFRPRGVGIEIVFKNKGSFVADALIGADGLRSVVRQQIHGSEAPVYRGYFGWRAVVPAELPDYAGRLSESWGKGKRFGIAPIGQGRCYWYATANRPAGWSDDPADRRKLLLELFGDWHKPVTDLISAASSEEIIAGPICDRVARRQWGRGRVTLLGDAAHPMTPNLGQGAATAIEDAWTVARCLEKERTVEAALRRYEHLRAPRLARVQSISRLLGRVIQLESPVAIACRDFVLRLTPNGMSSSVLKRVFSFDP